MALDYSAYMTQTAIIPYRGKIYCVGNYATTKKEKYDRIAKERMYASWKSYNDKTETIKEIKQIVKSKQSS